MDHHHEVKMINYKKIYCQISIILLISLLMGCAGARQKRNDVQMRSQRVQKTLEEIITALHEYQDDHGYFPKGMATLRDMQYLSIMPDIEREWNLKYYTDGGQVMMVEAVSRPSMPDGAGFVLYYRVPEGEWEGYGITEFP